MNFDFPFVILLYIPLFVGDFNMGNIICVKLLPRAIARGKICADNVTHIKISINYFYSNRAYTVNFLSTFLSSVPILKSPTNLPLPILKSPTNLPLP
jgi:hypothetical protein